MSITIRNAKKTDCALIKDLITGLGEYEKLFHEVLVSVEGLEKTLFGEKPYAEVLIGEWDGEPVSFALFFHNYSTFLAKPGIYLEDLFVMPKMRGHGIGKALLKHLARLAQERDCGRLEWSCLDWNEDALRFYRKVGAVPMQDWTVQRMDEKSIANFIQCS